MAKSGSKRTLERIQKIQTCLYFGLRVLGLPCQNSNYSRNMMLWRGLLLGCCLLVSFVAQAQLLPPVVVESAGPVSLAEHLSTFEDKSGQLGIVAVQAAHKAGAFRPMKDYILNAGYSSAQHWVHFRLTAKAHTYPMMLIVSNSRINHLRIYHVIDGKVKKEILTGDHLPFDSRRFPSRNFVVPLEVVPGQTSDIYVMAEKRHEVLAFQTYLWHLDAFEESERTEYLLWGTITGFILLILLLNLVLTFATKDRIYLWYMLLILTSAFQIASQTGLGFQYLWSNTPYFNHFDTTALVPWLIMVTQLHFIQQFIRQKPSSSRAYRYVQWYKVVLLVVFAGLVITRLLDVAERYWFRFMYDATLYCILSSVVLAYWSLFERVRKRESEVIFYIAVLSFQLIGYVLVFLINLRYTQPGVEPLFHVDSYFLMVGILLIDLLVITMGLLYFRFNDYRRQNERLLIELHRTEQEQADRTIEALEIERNRIAEDLYDDVGAMLSTGIGYISSVLRFADVKERFPALVEARKLLNTAIENLRTVSHNLMPKNFAQLGLAKSLNETVDKVSNPEGLRFRYICSGQEVRLATATEVQIFRIAAELINNVLKHSNATEATLQLMYHPDYLNLLLEDNSQGELGRFDLSNISSKVNFLNGSLDIDSGDSGTTVIVEIPYQTHRGSSSAYASDAEQRTTD